MYIYQTKRGAGEGVRRNQDGGNRKKYIRRDIPEGFWGINGNSEDVNENSIIK
jgi:hypothetical protein